MFVAVESVSSMDGTVSPRRAPRTGSSLRTGNPHSVIGDAHATGLYRPGGRGMVTVQGLENRGYWLYTFGKAFAASGVW